MLLWQKAKTKLIILRRIPYRYYFVAGVLFVMGLYMLAFRERTLAFNYGGETCDKRLVLLPGIFRQAGGEGYKVDTKGGWKLGSQQITATAVCVTPTEAPAENASKKVAYAPWGGWFGRLFYKVEIGKRPVVDAAILQQPVPATRELRLPLTIPDTTFSYLLKIDSAQVTCKPADEKLHCDMPALKLKQGSTYTAKLERHFKDTVVDEVVATKLETLSPLSIVDSSIKNDAVAYDKPQTIVLTTDKPVKQADLAVWRLDGDTPAQLKATTTFKGQEVTITLAEELPRQATIGIKSVHFEATDGSAPLDGQVLNFKTSGGPKVTGVNIGTSGVGVSAQVVVSFDQEISQSQDIAKLVTFSGGPAQISRSGSQVIFQLQNLPRCTPFSVQIAKGLNSKYDIASDADWAYASRTTCYTTSVYGTSLKGRALTAYYFGNDGPLTLYVGAIHGNESSSSKMMRAFIDDLEADPKILEGRRIVIVPTINPDGLTANTRTNARGVNLNRNFPTSDWVSDIKDTDGAHAGGGGSAPLSEPEAAALASLTTQLRPRMVLSYHAIGSLVAGDPGALSASYAAKYASMVGYRDATYASNSTFDYDITGSYEAWTYAKQGIPSIVVELGSYTSFNFPYHRAAIREML